MNSEFRLAIDHLMICGCLFLIGITVLIVGLVILLGASHAA